ncbi:putative Ribonuclease [Blattamonas nauphoetae]|uniref:Ribonuclease n=1 Tax=Blattamonas nauphoetae TaxID=2049346 RepID=A0ABQ9XSH5_9EUKA|nr:putative Ribonuclease [Blattamonas nauphoetae]
MDQEMSLLFVGTVSASPTISRNTSCVALRFDDGHLWLFDCGEGTQRELLKYPHINPSLVDVIFITHLHGDHVYGLFGLLCSLSFKRKNQPIDLIGPKGLKELLDCVLPLTDMTISYPINIHELPEDDVSTLTDISNPNQSFHQLGRNDVSVMAFPLSHQIRSFAFHVELRHRSSQVNIQRAHSYGIGFGHFFDALSCGQSVRLPNGVVVLPQDVCDLVTHRLLICGDCGDGYGRGKVHDRTQLESDIQPPLSSLTISPLSAAVPSFVPKSQLNKPKQLPPIPANYPLLSASPVPNTESPPQQTEEYGVGDANDWPRLVSTLEKVDTLVHETTFANELSHLAERWGHSTSKMAGERAVQLNAKTLIITHFSKRYTETPNGLQELFEQTREAAGNIKVLPAYDGFMFPLD